MNVEQWQTSKEKEVRELKELLDSGMLSQAEYEELVEDIIDIAKIQQDLDTEDLKNKAVKAIDAIKVVAGLL